MMNKKVLTNLSVLFNYLGIYFAGARKHVVTVHIIRRQLLQYYGHN